MKKFLFLLTILLISIISFAQNVPQGMKYQAVARNLSGNVLVNQSITLKINLITQDSKATTVYYSETHAVTTNEVGLFTLTIGEGKIEKGKFVDIPWSTADIWMQVAIKDKGQQDFMTISNSKLLAVPYAFHSGTATKISGNTSTSSTAGTSGIPAQVWSLKGNSGTNPATDRLGTTDSVDLILITNNKERIRIAANGNVDVTSTTQSNTPADGIAKNLNVGGNIKVNGSFSVTNDVKASSLNISGDSSGFIATITNTNSGDGDGLKIKLGRTHPMWNGTEYESIQVDDFNPVYHTFQPQITLVEGWVKTGNVTVTPADLLSLLSSTGQFLGGALCQLTNYISPILNQKIGLPLNLATPINNAIGLPFNVSAPINTGLTLPINISGPINTALGLPLNLATPINNALGLPYEILDETIIPAISSLTIPGIPAFSIPAIPNLTIPAIPTVALTIPAIPQIDCSGLPQIGAPTIKINDVTNSLTRKNEFMRFVDKDERTVGMIRSQSIGDFYNSHYSKEYLFHLVTAVGGIDIAKGLLNLAAEFNKVAHEYNSMGVEYISGNGDYAEWMEREDLEESISAGDIVGVKGGRITKSLIGAEQIMAVSTKPIVNANMPQNNRVELGNSIAFMGQIPVKIIGPVTTGDFIVAKGDIPGYGVAVKASQMTSEDFRLVVGRAWETIEVDGPKMVNTLVGVQNNDFLKIIEKYQQKVNDAEARLDAIEKRLNIISPVKNTDKKK
jgi:hypothetical protein